MNNGRYRFPSSAGSISAAYGVSDTSGLRCNRSPASRDSIYRVSEIDLSISLGAGNTSIFVPIVFPWVPQSSAGQNCFKCASSWAAVGAPRARQALEKTLYIAGILAIAFHRAGRPTLRIPEEFDRSYKVALRQTLAGIVFEENPRAGNYFFMKALGREPLLC